MNYEDFDLDNRTCVACGLPEITWCDQLCPDGAFKEVSFHVRCFNSPAALAWRDRQRKRDPAYESYLRWSVERAPIDCRHCGRKLEMSPKAIGVGGCVNCTRCHRTSRHGLNCFPRWSEQSQEAIHEAIKAIADVKFDFVRSLNLESIDRRMHEIRRKYNYLAVHGLCECGGPYALDAKARCPYCDQVAVDSYFHRVDIPLTPEQRREFAPCESLRPPSDWNDARGWNLYFRGRTHYVSGGERELTLGGKDVSRFPAMFRDWWERGWWNVWFPGCGISSLPKLFASVGFTVHATDLAETAVIYQRYDDSPRLRRWITENDPTFPKYTGRLIAEVHDMRTRYRDGFFDLVINTHALAGLPSEDMRRVARSHCAALKPGGRAFFEVVTLDPEVPNKVEAILDDAGFFVPNLRLNRRARGQLSATGIPHVFLKGRPVIPRLGAYQDDGLRRRDALVLREIISRYAPYARGIDAPPDDCDAKTAVITYSHL